jgi:hypothetical protein
MTLASPLILKHAQTSLKFSLYRLKPPFCINTVNLPLTFFFSLLVLWTHVNEGSFGESLCALCSLKDCVVLRLTKKILQFKRII